MSTQDKFTQVHTEDLRVNTLLDFDIFIKSGRNIVLFRKNNRPFTLDTLNNLTANKVKTIYILNDEIEKFERYFNSHKGKAVAQMSEKEFAAPFDKPENVEKYYKSYFNYYPIEKDGLIPGTRVNFNVYRKSDADVALFFGPQAQDSATAIVPEEAQDSWTALVIHNDDIPQYREYLKNVAVELSKGDAEPSELRFSVMRENSKLIVKEVLENPRSGDIINSASSLVEDLTGAILENKSNFCNLLKITTHDYYTYTHSLNVCSLSIGLGTILKLSDSQLIELGLGALLHDIGKCSVDPHILNKPGKLSKEEFKSIQCHVDSAEEILSDKKNQIPQNSFYSILQHHEKLSGSGYPLGLKGDQIHLYGRITGIVDVYDALTTERPYKRAYKPFEAFQVLGEIKDDYDQKLLKVLVVMLGSQTGGMK